MPRYIKLVKKHGLEISQPGLVQNKGFITWQMTRRRENGEVHKWVMSHSSWTFIFNYIFIHWVKIHIWTYQRIIWLVVMLAIEKLRRDRASVLILIFHHVLRKSPLFLVSSILHCHYWSTRNHFDLICHLTGRFVEIMATVFSRDAWRCVWHMIQVSSSPLIHSIVISITRYKLNAIVYCCRMTWSMDGVLILRLENV